MKPEKAAILEKIFETIGAKQFKGKAEKLRELTRDFKDVATQMELPCVDEEQNEQKA